MSTEKNDPRPSDADVGCRWYDEDVPNSICGATVTHYSCNFGGPTNGPNVCEEHKCRCKQPAPRTNDAPAVIDRATSTEAEVQAAIREAVVTGQGLTIAENGITRMQIAARRPVPSYDEDEPRVDKVQASRESALQRALIGLLGWANGGACSDCDMFRTAPSAIEWQHEEGCGHLADINRALALLGRAPLTGHTYEDPAAEMKRLADERAARVAGRVTKVHPLVPAPPITVEPDTHTDYPEADAIDRLRRALGLPEGKVNVHGVVNKAIERLVLTPDVTDAAVKKVVSRLLIDMHDQGCIELTEQSWNIADIIKEVSFVIGGAFDARSAKAEGER